MLIGEEAKRDHVLAMDAMLVTAIEAAWLAPPLSCSAAFEHIIHLILDEGATPYRFDTTPSS